MGLCRDNAQLTEQDGVYGMHHAQILLTNMLALLNPKNRYLRSIENQIWYCWA